MVPDIDRPFSEVEVVQVRAFAEEEFPSELDWTVRNVTRRPAEPDVVEVVVENKLDERTVTLVLPHQEYEGENVANLSRLTDTVFNVSIRLMEFVEIRGLDECEDGAMTTLEVYPGGSTTTR